MNSLGMAKQILGQGFIYDLWDSVGDLFGSAIKSGPDIYKAYNQKRTADEQLKAAQAAQAAAAQNAVAAQQTAIAAQALNPTILGMPSAVVLLGGLGLAALGITIALVKK